MKARGSQYWHSGDGWELSIASAMCGILGVVAVRGSVPSVSDAQVQAMRERLERRGPDGAGLVRWENTVLAHRRLAILDPSAAGQQPKIGRAHV